MSHKIESDEDATAALREADELIQKVRCWMQEQPYNGALMDCGVLAAAQQLIDPYVTVGDDDDGWRAARDERRAGEALLSALERGSKE